MLEWYFVNFTSNSRIIVNNKLERMPKEAVMSISLEYPRKTRKILIQDSHFSCKYLNSQHSRHEAAFPVTMTFAAPTQVSYFLNIHLTVIMIYFLIFQEVIFQTSSPLRCHMPSFSSVSHLHTDFIMYKAASTSL
jgi:hypothetical protein